MSFEPPAPYRALDLDLPELPDLDEPGPDQRWSTWPSTAPSERGPQPYPDWLVTAAAAFDTELGIVKTGKEADVFLLERAIPGAGGCFLAAKRYRDSQHSDFIAKGRYEEGKTNAPLARRAGRRPKIDLRSDHLRGSLGHQRVRCPLQGVGCRHPGALPRAAERHEAADGVHRHGTRRIAAAGADAASGERARGAPLSRSSRSSRRSRGAVSRTATSRRTTCSSPAMVASS